MRALFYRLTALSTGALGLLLIAMVCRAVYLRDDAAQSLMFRLGMPLVLLSTLAGGLLFCVAGLLMKSADQRFERRR